MMKKNLALALAGIPLALLAKESQSRPNVILILTDDHTTRAMSCYGGIMDTPNLDRLANYYHFYEFPSWHMAKRHYGIRTERYKLIHFYRDIDEWKLYDLKKDPNELNNVYGNPSYKSVRKRMHRRLSELQEEVKDTNPDELK